VILQSHDNDGADPSTHSIIAVYPSMAESEAYGKMIENDKDGLAAWLKMMGKMAPISTVTYTGLFARIGSWGKLSDKNTVWLTYSLSAKDAPSVYRALDSWINSELGKQFPGQMHLTGVIAAGIGRGTHTVNIGYENIAEMENWADKTSGSAPLAQLQHRLSVVGELHGVTRLTEIMLFGKSGKSIFN
jgi:hypothetical protein